MIKYEIELTPEQLSVVKRALNLMAQQHFDIAMECKDEDFSKRNIKMQEEYDDVLEVIREQAIL